MNNTVMLVEDNSEARQALAALLSLRGHQVIEAAHGREALALLHTQPLPALIVLDLMMPVMDGWAFLECKEADAELAPIPVVINSAVSELCSPVHARSVVACVGKLVDVQPLLALIRECCEGALSRSVSSTPTAAVPATHAWC